MRIDLHTHSTCSDGTSSPAQLVREAVAAGLDVLAVTDHDSTAGWDDAARAAEEAGVQLVRGIEVSTKHQGGSLHLLAYLPDPTHGPLQRMLAMIIEGRDQRIPHMVAKLQGLGIDITEQAVLAKASDAAAVGRPYVADVLVDLGVVRSRDEAFRDYLSSGGKGYVSRPAPSIEEAIDVVRGAGGVAVIAHPWGREGDRGLDLDELARLRGVGLTGLEVDHLDHTDQQREELRDIAAELDLVVTGSSDYHGLGKPEHLLGVCTTAPAEYERLLHEAASSAAAAGREPTPVVGAP